MASGSAQVLVPSPLVVRPPTHTQAVAGSPAGLGSQEGIKEDVNIIKETNVVSVTLSEAVIWVLQTETIHFSKWMCAQERRARSPADMDPG